MEIRTSPSMKVLYSTHQTMLSEVGQLAGTVVKQIFEDAVNNGWLISGTSLWIYKGADGQPGTLFTLEIAVPVQGNGKKGKFDMKELPPFRSVNLLHEFGWDKLTATYAQIMQQVMMDGLQMTGECREIYLNVDFINPDNNRTEVQVGIV